MCGISGLIDFKQSSSFDVLQIMSDTLYHRGPDGSGLEFLQTKTCQVGLGHRRLSIIDLTDAGKQPMQFEHLWITFNGEIYNYKEIKQELIILKHKFHGGSALSLKEDYTRTTAAYQQNKSALEAFKKKRVNLYDEPSQLLNEDRIKPDSDLI